MSSVKHIALPALALLALTACDMPTEPSGAGVEGFATIGENLQKQGDDAGAADFYQRALQRKPNDLHALRDLGGLLEAHGNIEAADGYYTKALVVAPDDADLLLAHGRLLLKLGRADDAKNVYQKLVTANPHNVKALNGLGIAEDYLGQHDEAEKNYQAAQQEAPNDLTALNNLAHSHVLAGRYNEAIALLEPHATDPAATSALRQNLAEAYGMNGMYADAERMARKDLKPEDVKRNLAFYRAHRAKVTSVPKFAADLGAYPTQQMAEARAEKARALLADPKIAITVTPQVGAIGGTPSFLLNASGFPDAEHLGSFCEQMMKNDIGCKIANGT